MQRPGTGRMSGRTGERRCVFFLQAEDGIRDYKVTGVQTCALPICSERQDLPTNIGASAGAQNRGVPPSRESSAPRTTATTPSSAASGTVSAMKSERSEERRVGKEGRSRGSPYH